MLRDGESGLGVEDEDEAERTRRFYFHGQGSSGPNPAAGLTVESSGGASTIQPVLETGEHNWVIQHTRWGGWRKRSDSLSCLLEQSLLHMVAHLILVGPSSMMVFT